MQPQGFSLIELLIVVLIIGILATIAIPNLGQARVRAKVARAKAEMQMCASSLECYYVDTGDYPNDHENGWCWFLTRQLTTPIRYMVKKQMDDSFKESVVLPGIYSSVGQRYRYINYDANVESAAGKNWGQLPGPANPDPDFRGSVPSLDACRLGMSVFGKWKLASTGPDQIETQTDFIQSDLLYDPTNGVNSAGDIVRPQIGIKPRLR